MPAEPRTETLARGDADGAGDAATGPYLFVVLDARNIDAPPARIALAGIDEVTLGRGAERRLEVQGRRALIELPDAGMSRVHARATRAFGGFVIEDAGSKNGTLVGGRTAARVELADGDVIEVGRTFLLFRRALPFDPRHRRCSTPRRCHRGRRGCSRSRPRSRARSRRSPRWRPRRCR